MPSDGVSLVEKDSLTIVRDIRGIWKSSRLIPRSTRQKGDKSLTAKEPINPSCTISEGERSKYDAFAYIRT